MASRNRSDQGASGPAAPERAITGSFENNSRSSAGSSSHQAATGSVSCVPVIAADTAGYCAGSRNGCPSVCQCRSQRITRQPGTSSLARDSRTKSGIEPRSSAIRSRPPDARMPRTASPWARCARLVGRGEERGTIRPSPVGAEEPDDVIDPHPVEQHRRALGAPADPGVVGLGDDLPVVGRQSPVLTRPR